MTQSGTLKDELRRTFLFESLSDEQLDWLVAHGAVEDHPAGVYVYIQGDSAEAFYVLLDGEIELVKRMDGTDVVLSTTSQPGSYAGVMRAFINVSGAQSWASSLRTVRNSQLFKLSADDFAYLLQTWFPMAVHLLDGMFLGLTNADAIIGQREKLIALGAALGRPGPRAQQPGGRRGPGRRSSERPHYGRPVGHGQAGARG